MKFKPKLVKPTTRRTAEAERERQAPAESEQQARNRAEAAESWRRTFKRLGWA